jgi:hypothetical protein
MIEEMEGVAGISRPRRRLFPGGGSKARSLQLPSGGITPPSVGRSKGGEVPQLHRPLFCLVQRCKVVLHEDDDHAKVIKG